MCMNVYVYMYCMYVMCPHVCMKGIFILVKECGQKKMFML